MSKIFLTADSPCDIGPELIERYSVTICPLHVLVDGNDYLDDASLDFEMIYRLWQDKKLLPKTAAVSVQEYLDVFEPMTKQGAAVIHISLGSGLSCSYQNACIAAESLENVFVIDSRSLSTGFGLLVCEAGERIKKGMDAKQIYDEVCPLGMKTSASFVLDTLDFLHAGGRCSSLAQLGANLMSIKPQIKVLNEKGGSMSVGKKYVGKFEKCVLKYMENQVAGRDDIVLDRVFITHAGLRNESLVEEAKQLILSLQPFKEVHITRASSTISSHCGKDTIGVLFLTR